MSEGRYRQVHVLDAFGQPIPPFPIEIETVWASGTAPAVFEADGKIWLVVNGAVVRPYPPWNWHAFHLFDLETGTEPAGWPFTGGIDAQAVAIGDFGQSGPVSFLWGGGGAGNRAFVEGYDFWRNPLPGYPRSNDAYSIFEVQIAVDTLDGIETTACWLTNGWGSSVKVDCFDVGAPWDRGRIQWGNYGFDLQHTSRFRRLWQIDRTKTCLEVPVSELSSSAVHRFDVKVCPRDSSDAPLGADQRVRFARRPVIGEFVGAVRYDPMTATYSRTFEMPIRREGAEIEFRVFVNEELDDTRPMVRLVGWPRIASWNPAGVERGGGLVTATLRGVDFGAAPTLSAADPSLVVVSSRPGTDEAAEAVIRAPAGAAIGWSGLVVVAPDGRASGVAPIFVYERGKATLAVREGGSAGETKLDWFGPIPPGVAVWRLERSTAATFGSYETLYRGAGRTYLEEDSPGFNETWFYRAR